MPFQILDSQNVALFQRLGIQLKGRRLAIPQNLSHEDFPRSGRSRLPTSGDSEPTPSRIAAQGKGSRQVSNNGTYPPGRDPYFDLDRELRNIRRLERERSAVHERITQICAEAFASRCQGGGENGNPHGFDFLEDSIEEAHQFAKLKARQMQGIAALTSETVPIPAATKIYFSRQRKPV